MWQEVGIKVLVAVACAVAGGITVWLLGKTGIIRKIIDKICKNRKEKREKAQKDKEDDLLKRFSEIVDEKIDKKFDENLIPLKKELDIVKKTVELLKQDIDVMKIGDRAGLKNVLLTCFYRCEAKGFRTVDDSENYRILLEAYHNLKGNSFIDGDITPNFDKIPLKNVAFKSGKKVRKQVPVEHKKK